MISLKQLIHFDKNRLFILLLLILGISVFIFGYTTLDVKPSDNSIGFYGGYDQSQYFQMAKELSHFSLKTFTYGIGYPLIGALFYNLYPRDPFLIPNFLFYIGTIILLYISFKIIFKKSFISFLSVLLFVIATPIVSYVYFPWNSTVNLFFYSLIFFIIIKNKLNILTCFLLALSMWWIFAARYIDIIFISPIIVYYFWSNRKHKHILKYFIYFGLMLVLLITPIFLLHQTYFGSPFKTPYINHLRTDGNSDQDLSRYNLTAVPKSIKTILLGIGNSDDQKYEPLLKTTPILFLLPVGIIGVLISRNKPLKIVLFSFLLALTFYSSFPAFNGFNIRYGCIHYIKMWFPYLILIIVYGILEIVNRCHTHYRKRIVMIDKEKY